MVHKAKHLKVKHLISSKKLRAIPQLLEISELIYDLPALKSPVKVYPPCTAAVKAIMYILRTYLHLSIKFVQIESEYAINGHDLDNLL